LEKKLRKITDGGIVGFGEDFSCSVSAMQLCTPSHSTRDVSEIGGGGGEEEEGKKEKKTRKSSNC
jgi:hypothetical protein